MKSIEEDFTSEELEHIIESNKNQKELEEKAYKRYQKKFITNIQKTIYV